MSNSKRQKHEDLSPATVLPEGWNGCAVATPTLVPEGTPPVYPPRSPALCLQVHAVDGEARACTMHLPHGPVQLPTFMPVGTKGTIKGLTSRQLDRPELSPQIILGNTYHLALQPGTELLDQLGGLHGFMNWRRNLLTDSGGFQMVSLLELAAIDEEGVTFQSPVDGTTMLLRPEDSIAHQNRIGADIMMQLDDVVSSVTEDAARFEEACHRTTRWLDRCVAANQHPATQNLFAIVQGGLDTNPGGLREVSLRDLVARDLPGYAIGGLAGGEAKGPFWRVVHQCCQRLPRDKPRYLMGVGYPLDLVVCVALGVDMFDCVYPTRTARFGVALTDAGPLKIKGKAMASDPNPTEAGCPCMACAETTTTAQGRTKAAYSRAALHALFKSSATSPLACQLLTAHNLAYMLGLSRRMRAAVLEGAYPRFLRAFLEAHFKAPAQTTKTAKTASAAASATASASRSEEAPAGEAPAAGEETAAAVTGPGVRATGSGGEGEDKQAPSELVVPIWVDEALEAAGCDWRNA